jgi:selenophosphate synthetase-related protein
MIKYKDDTASIDNLEDALELFARNGIWVRITNKAKADPYGQGLKEAFFKGIKDEN